MKRKSNAIAKGKERMKMCLMKDERGREGERGRMWVSKWGRKREREREMIPCYLTCSIQNGDEFPTWEGDEGVVVCGQWGMQFSLFLSLLTTQCIMCCVFFVHRSLLRKNRSNSKAPWRWGERGRDKEREREREREKRRERERKGERGREKEREREKRRERERERVTFRSLIQSSESGPSTSVRIGTYIHIWASRNHPLRFGEC
jgi:hypothetical protein